MGEQWHPVVKQAHLFKCFLMMIFFWDTLSRRAWKKLQRRDHLLTSQSCCGYLSRTKSRPQIKSWSQSFECMMFYRSYKKLFLLRKMTQRVYLKVLKETLKYIFCHHTADVGMLSSPITDFWPQGLTVKGLHSCNPYRIPCMHAKIPNLIVCLWDTKRVGETARAPVV